MSDLRTSELLWIIPSHLYDLLNISIRRFQHSWTKTLLFVRERQLYKTRVPWFTDEIRSIRRLCRQSEQKWRRTKLDSDWQAFKALRNRTTFVMSMVLRQFCSVFVNKMSGDRRKVFAITKNMLNQVTESPFPEHCHRLSLANEMRAFFKMKIPSIRCS